MFFSKRLNNSSDWQATVTPLASIMGSGFLVSAPLLAGLAGNWEACAMAVLLLLAYGVGSIIQFNIQYFEDIENKTGKAQSIAFASRIILTCSYFISVCYYLQLLASFLLNIFNIHNVIAAKILTTCVLTTIALIGITKGLDKQEKVEKITTSVNFAMIGALILSLALYNFQLLHAGTWQLQPLQFHTDSHSWRVLLGLLIVIQGFETSRYLGAKHSKEQRIRTMRYAQLISTIIYLIFLLLVTVLFKKGLGTNITAIITMAAPLSPILPILLSIAAIGSQFCASTADSEGAEGLLQDLSKNKFNTSKPYIVILIVTVILTWTTQVTEIIAYASRAFALYYSLQCLVGVFTLHQVKGITNRGTKTVFFSVMSLICFIIFVFGLPVG